MKEPLAGIVGGPAQMLWKPQGLSALECHLVERVCDVILGSIPYSGSDCLSKPQACPGGVWWDLTMCCLPWAAGGTGSCVCRFRDVSFISQS